MNSEQIHPQNMKRYQALPAQAGIGLRSQHVKEILSVQPDIPYLEVLVDNYLTPGGIHLAQLEQIRSHYPISFHCVGMSIGSVDPINFAYLEKIKQLRDRFAPNTISDHLCWTQYAGQNFHDLLPLPYTEEALEHLCQRIHKIQDYLQSPLIIENVSSYITFNESSYTEGEFLAELAKRSGCQLLLDINNLYVSAQNHHFDPMAYLSALSPTQIAQYHLAGHEKKADYLLDAHNNPVSTEVWELFGKAVQKFGARPTLIEWDNEIPKLSTLLSEAETAQTILTCHQEQSFSHMDQSAEVNSL